MVRGLAGPSYECTGMTAVSHTFHATSEVLNQALLPGTHIVIPDAPRYVGSYVRCLVRVLSTALGRLEIQQMLFLESMMHRCCRCPSVLELGFQASSHWKPRLLDPSTLAPLGWET